MNHTPNYNLPQWELDDLIRMEDFNSAMANVENALTGNKADAEAEAAETRAIANSAKVTANAAQAAAAVKPYVVGSYVGTGEQMDINLGFRPSFLIVSGMMDSTSPTGSGTWENYMALAGGSNSLQHKLLLTDTGFTVYETPHGNYWLPIFSEKGRTYDYIAFK